MPAMEFGYFDRPVKFTGSKFDPHTIQPSRCALFLLATALLLVSTATIFAQPTARQPSQADSESANQQIAVVESLRTDASLADVCFVDANTGWAVGDRGVIWHT